LLVGTTNVASALNLKADTSSVYTRSQAAAAFQSTLSFLSPLKNTVNILSNVQEVSIDTTVAFPIGDIESSGTLSIDTIEAHLADHVQFNNNLSVEGNLYATGNLDIDGSATVDGQLAVSRIMYTNTTAVPTLGYRNEGTKLVLYNSLSDSILDHSIGVEPSYTFFTVANSASGYKFYAGPAVAATIYGNGDINAAASITATGTIAGASAQITNNCTIGGNCTITGALTVSGTTSFANPYWVAVVIGFVGGAPTIVRNGGRYAATSLMRVSGQPTGIIQFDFPAHPQGTNYIISITASAGYGTIYALSRSSTRFGLTTRNISNNLFDTETHILILAY
jgi:hypothetical protein